MKTEKIILGDGKEYSIGAFNVGDFIEIEKKFGSVSLQADKMEPMIFWFWLAIKKCNDSMKLKDLYELIDAPFISNGGMAKLFDAMSKLNGWDKTTKNEDSPVKVAQ